MSKLFEAMNSEVVTTENGCKTNQTSLNKNLDFFFTCAAMRGTSDKNLFKVLSGSLAENQEITLRIVQWLRDVRGGAGERDVFLRSVKYILNDHTVSLSNKISLLSKISEIGRWKDYLSLLSMGIGEFENTILSIISKGFLSNDALLMKWLPRPNGSASRKALAKKIYTFLKLTPKQYRKILSENTKVVETAMCNNDWNSIDFSHVPSKAFSIYKNAFRVHNETGFDKFLEKVEKGEAKINAGAIFPHDVIKEVFHSSCYDAKAIDLQWKALPDYLEDSDENILTVVDTSGSMFSSSLKDSVVTCGDVAVSLGIYLSERMKGIFKNHFITFSTEPSLQMLKGTVTQKAKQLERADWDGSTNISAVFELILNAANMRNLDESEMPTKILILSDMEFNECGNMSGFENIRQMYENSGYKLPQIVFWNIQSRSTNNIPVTMNDEGVALVSGFSPSIVKSVLVGDLDPVKVMMKTIMNERYSL